ncbi:hypothetical protein RvY_04231 [Ramazzottius varieornatus]|uniref:Uncharacterized protein n=1 Tax=Ramazzottius varieornatus TaxID=947166 RepID=A0A1D1UQY0_RAMVA|nr:hypothetical protein RvY_04231 [Ramazzottius varieornatus]
MADTYVHIECIATEVTNSMAAQAMSMQSGDKGFRLADS